jgi:AcrR family transcriptional regulator
VEEIAAAAGVAKGTLFYNFGSKDELYRQVLMHGAERFAERLQTAVQGLDAAAALGAYVLAGLDTVRDEPSFARIFLAELYGGRAEHAQVIAEARALVVAVTTDLLVSGQVAGLVDPRIDVDVAAGLLLALVLVAAREWQVFAPQRSVVEVHEDLMSLLRGRFRP